MRTLLVLFAQFAIEVAAERGSFVDIRQVDQKVRRIPIQAKGAEPLVAQKDLQLRRGR
ncbi:hypothetical protein D3C76_1288250 [compost metagenome]